MSDINKQIEEWNWSNGRSIGIVKSSKDLESLKKLIAQAQQEAERKGKRKLIIQILESELELGDIENGMRAVLENDFNKNIKVAIKALQTEGTYDKSR